MVYTHQSNTNKHPGHILKGAPCRSAEDMAEVRRIEAKAKELAAQQQVRKLQVVAALEYRLAQENNQATTFGTALPRMVVTRPARVGAKQPFRRLPRQKTPAKAAPQTTTPKSSTKARQTKSSCADINTYCKELEDADTENQPVTPAAGKRKSMAVPDEPHVKSTNKKKPAHPSGLLAGWAQGSTNKPSKSNPAVAQRQPISASGNAVCNSAPRPKSTTATDVQDFGGYISSNDDDSRVQWWSSESGDGNGKIKVTLLIRSDLGLGQGIITIKHKEPASLIKDELDAVLLKLAPEVPGGSGTKGGFVKADLPIGTISNPWEITSLEQDLVFQDMPQVVTLQCAIYAVALQKVYKWRSNFAKTAAEHIWHFFKHDIQEALKRCHLEDTPEGRTAWVSQQITGNFLFQYGKINILGEDGSIISWGKSFQSTLVLSTLVHHINAMLSALPYVEAVLKGALAMSVVVVKCAIGMYSMGVYEPADKVLEQMWSLILNLYKRSIDAIIISAMSLSALSRDYSLELDNNNAQQDGRVLIVDGCASD
ncbi:hypothetical protein B0H21DRAFT_709048 [Amylocystis lapponica]|nr:hypothetical protein B0H21DRAFT_709048 [Amylocystis lapponica]